MRYAEVAILTLLVVGGCTRPAKDFLVPSEPAIVWPTPPDAPRVRYINDLTGSEDVGATKRFGEVWDELLYGPKPPARLVTPQDVAVNDKGNRIAVADVNGKCVHLFDVSRKQHTPLVVVGTDKQLLECPVAVGWMDDTLWVADAMLHRVAVFDASGRGRWIATEELKRPAGLACCRTNRLCYVVDTVDHAVKAFDEKGQLVTRFGSRGSGPGQFNYPSHIACGPDDTLVVADSLNFRIQRFALDGTFLGMFGRKGDAAGDLALPKGVAVDAAGDIWVVDAHFENVQAFTPQGQLLMTFGKEGHGPGEFWLPAGACIDAQNRLWIADRDNGRVQVFALRSSS